MNCAPLPDCTCHAGRGQRHALFCEQEMEKRERERRAETAQNDERPAEADPSRPKRA